MKKTLVLTDPSTAAALLIKDEVVALPTETVYGLAGNATQPDVVKKIFTAKERPSFDPLIVHVWDSILQNASPLQALVDREIISGEVLSWNNRSAIESVMRLFWPGPLTMILPKGAKIPAEVTSNQPTVGIRCPKHPLFQKVLAAIDFPLAAPSANRFGRISPTSADHVMKELDGRIAAVLDGGTCEVGVESTIIHITEIKIDLLRPGKISRSELETAFGSSVNTAPSLMQKISEAATNTAIATSTDSNTSPDAQISQDTPITPGMLDEHYAPRKPLYLIPYSFQDPQAIEALATFPDATASDSAILAMSGFHAEFSAKFIGNHPRIVRILSPSGSSAEMAQKLFATLRELDEDPAVKMIFADVPGSIQEGLGASIYDRLKRASRNKPNPGIR
jgi:L-threonylcarbamoyladenylate synthase